MTETLEQIYRKGGIDALAYLTDSMEQHYSKTGALKATDIIILTKQTLAKFREAPITELTWKQQNKSH